MATKEIFRLEESNKELRRGVYNSNKGWDIMNDKYNPERDENGSVPRHPMPRKDSKIVQECEKRDIDADCLNDGEFRFGFLSINQLRSWFYNNDSLIELGKAGIILRIYSAPEENIIAGNTQCCFSEKFHTLENIVEEIELSELVKGFIAEN